MATDFAIQFRAAIDMIFGSRRIEDLKAQLQKQEELTRYFQARADRFETELLTRTRPQPAERRPVPQGVVGRPNWSKVQAEQIEILRKKHEAEAKAKEQN